jgi:hypothetical protein
MKSRYNRFELGMTMLPGEAQAEVLARIELDLPEPKAGRRVRKRHDHDLHLPNRRCNACKLEILGNVAADLGRLDVMRLLN